MVLQMFQKNESTNFKIILVLVGLFQVVMSNEYESGLIQEVLYSPQNIHPLAQTRAADATLSITRNFAKPFSQAPQIIYSCYNLYFDTAATGGYIFQIVSQDQTGFTIIVSAPTNQKIYNVLIKWLAFIDYGKQVIVEDLYSPDATETFDETHYNVNFAMAVPVLNYFVYSGAFNFKFDISAVTSTAVSVVVTSSGITQIGFQLLLAVASPVYLYGPTQYVPPGNQLYNNPYVVNSASIPALQQSDYINFPLFTGLSGSVTSPLDIESLSFNLGSTLSFSIGASNIYYKNSNNLFNIIWLAQLNVVSPRYQIPPLLLESFTQTEYLDTKPFAGITVDLPQTTTQYTFATATSNWITLDNSLVGLQVVIVMDCPFTYQHNYWFIGSVEDNKQYIADYFYCSDGFNRMQYSINLNDGGRMETKYIKITIDQNNNFVQINQQLTNIQQDEIYRNLYITKTSAR